jgi:hypothetical protein
MTERWPAARKYRDVFERIKMSVTDVIAQGNHQATRAAGILDAEMTERCRTLDQGLPGAARTDYTQMITDMARERNKQNGAANGCGASEIHPDLSGGSDSRRQRQDNLQGHGHGTEQRLGVWPGPMLEYGNAQMSGLADLDFLQNLEDFDGMNAGWDMGLLDGANNFGM